MDIQVEPVVQKANANRKTFATFCRSLSPDELRAVIPESTWTVKDYLAHLASIDVWVGEWFEHLADGQRWRPSADDGGPFDIDVWNETRIQERRAATVPELLDEAAGHRERLWAAVDRFTPKVLAGTFPFRGRTVTLLRYLELWTAHDPAHTADTLRAIPERASDAALREWLAAHSVLAAGLEQRPREG